jgi:type IV pilus assembly protein PilQ
VLGNFFKNTTKVDDKDELLVFVTPKIIREGVNVN